MQKSKIAQMVRGQVFKRGKRQSSDRFGEKVARDFSTQSQITATQALNFQSHTRKFVFPSDNTNFTVEHKSDLWHKVIFSLYY